MALARAKEIITKVVKELGACMEENDIIVVKLKHDAPIFLNISMPHDTILISLNYKDLKDYIRELIDTEENPREILEGVLDDLTELATRISQSLMKNGFKTRMDIREKILDILEELEEALEE
ncbi:MAG: hypothetical protein ABWW69_07420 [Pyrodictiaceae archaeon]